MGDLDQKPFGQRVIDEDIGHVAFSNALPMRKQIEYRHLGSLVAWRRTRPLLSGVYRVHLEQSRGQAIGDFPHGSKNAFTDSIINACGDSLEESAMQVEAVDAAPGLSMLRLSFPQQARVAQDEAALEPTAHCLRVALRVAGGKLVDYAAHFKHCWEFRRPHRMIIFSFRPNSSVREWE